MKCDNAAELMSLYIDKELNREDEQLLLQHINKCEKCKIEFEQLKLLVEELNNVPLADLPKGYHEEIVNKLKDIKIENVERVNIFKPKEFKNLQKHNWKKYSAIAAAFLLVLVVGGSLGSIFNVGFGSSKGAIPESVSQLEAPATEAKMYSREADIANDEAITGEGAAYDNEKMLAAVSDTSQKAVLKAKSSSDGDSDERMKIKKLYVGIEVKNFDGAIKQLRETTEANGGYVENYTSYVYNYDDSKGVSLKQGEITLRMPKENYEASKAILEKIGRITDENETTEDVTAEYVDTQGRLNMKIKEEERLLQLIEKSNTIEDIIKIESRLGEIRADIESYTTSIRNWDRLVKFSTITLNIYEVSDSKISSIDSDFSSKIKNSFITSINSLSIFGQNVIIAFAALIVPLCILAVLAVIVIIVIKRYNKKHSKHND